MIRKTISFILVVAMIFIACGETMAATLSLPDQLRAIEEEAFEGDTSLDQVVLPEEVESIGSRSFANSSLREINLPESLSFIADDAFENVRPHITAVEGSYAYQWAADHGYLLGFDDQSAYEFHTLRAAFDDNMDAGLYHESWIRNYQISDYDELAGYKEGEPVWNAELVGDAHGAVLTLYNADWAGDGARAIDLCIENEPNYPCELYYQVTCTWDGDTVTSYGTLEYVNTPLPSEVVADDALYMTINQTSEIQADVLPQGYSFGDFEYIDFWTDMNCDNLEDWQDDQMHRYIVPREAGVFEGCIVKRYNNIQMRKPVIIYVENEEGVVPEPAPVLEENYYFNMCGSIENGAGFNVYVDNRTLGINPGNWSVCRNQYGEDWDWTFQTISGQEAQVSWYAAEDYFEFSLDNLYEYDNDTEVIVEGTLHWGETTATTLLYFNIVNLVLPEQVDFDQTIRMKSGESYRAYVQILPVDWDADYFLWYEINNGYSFDLWSDENTSFCLKANEPGYYAARPHLHILDNVFLFGDWFSLAVYDEDESIPDPDPYFQLNGSDTYELDFMLGDFAPEDGEGWYSSNYLFGWVIDNLPALYEAYGDDPDIEWGYVHKSGIELSLQLNPRQQDRFVGDRCDVELAEMPVETGVSEFDLYCDWNGHRGVLPCRVYISEAPERVPNTNTFPEEITVGVGQSVTVSGHYPDGEYDVPEDYHWIIADNDYVSVDEGNNGNIILTGLQEGTITGQARVGVNSNAFAQKPVTIHVVGDSMTAEDLIALISDDNKPESVHIDTDELTPLSTDGVTDPEELADIETYNEKLPELEAAVAEYNAAVDDLMVQLSDLLDAMGLESVDIEEDYVGITSDIITYGYSRDVSDLLTGDYTVVSSRAVSSQVFEQEIEKGGSTYYLVQSDSGLSVSTEPLMLSRAGEEVTIDVDRLEFNDDFIKRLQRFLAAINGCDFAGSAIADTIRKLPESIRMNFQRLNDIFPVGELWKGAEGIVNFVGLEASISDWNEDWAVLNELNSIANHGHPTEIEKLDSDSMQASSDLAMAITDARIAFIMDQLANFADIGLSTALLCSFILGVGELFTAVSLSGAAPAAIRGLAAKLETTGGKGLLFGNSLIGLGLSDHYDECFARVREFDNKLHYSFYGVVKDEKGTPLSDVHVVCGNAEAYTDSNGYYEIEAVSDSVKVTFSKDEYQEIKDKEVFLEPQKPEPVYVTMYKEQYYGTITGTVRDKDTGLPISGARVYASDEYCVTTKTSGTYSITVPIETTKLYYEAEGYISEDYDVIVVKDTTRPQDADLESAMAIHNRQELEAVANNTSGRYYLANDISLAGDPWTPLPWFSGKLDGRGHSITGMQIEESFDGNAGLFAGLTGAEIKKLTISGASISIPGDYSFMNAGLLCGNMMQEADVYDSTFSGNIVISDGTVRGGAFAGGVSGLVKYGSIHYCQVSVNIEVNYMDNIHIGGFFAQMQSGSLYNCTFSGNLHGNQTGNNSSVQVFVVGTGDMGSLHADKCDVYGSIRAESINAFAMAVGLPLTNHGNNYASVTASSYSGKVFAAGCQDGIYSHNHGSVIASSWENNADAAGINQISFGSNSGSVSASSVTGDTTAICVIDSPGSTNTGGSPSASSTHGNHYSAYVE